MKYALVLSTLILSSSLSGCGSSEEGPQRMVVTGQVTYDGKPVSQGEIWFLPAEGRSAPQAGAKIKDGKYRVENKGGVPIGSCIVKITAERPMENVKVVADGGPEEIPTSQYLPEKYNTETELTAQIESASEPVQKDFDLKP